MKPLQRLEWAEQLHTYYWEKLCSKLTVPLAFDYSEPTLTFNFRASRVAGKAGARGCTYNVNYLIEYGDSYEQTIAHEIAHSFADRLDRNAGHGCLWAYVMRVGCCRTPARYHQYKVPTERTELVEKLRKYWNTKRRLSKAACTSAV